MTDRGDQLARRLAADLEDLRELARVEAAEADVLVSTLVSHLRAWVPQSMPCALETDARD